MICEVPLSLNYAAYGVRVNAPVRNDVNCHVLARRKVAVRCRPCGQSDAGKENNSETANAARAA